MKKFDLPPLWTILTLFLTWLVNHFLPEPSLHQWLTPWLGYGLMAYGAYLAIWAVISFRKFRTPIHPKRKPKELIQIGPYALSRNPIYTAMVLFAMGFALALGSVYGLLPVIGLFFLLRQRFVEPEEQLLREAFGAEAEDYIAKTRRW